MVWWIQGRKKNKHNWSKTEIYTEVSWASNVSYSCQGKCYCKANGASERHRAVFEPPWYLSVQATSTVGRKAPFTRNWCVFSFSCSDSFQLGTCLGTDLLLWSFHESIFLVFVSCSCRILTVILISPLWCLQLLTFMTGLFSPFLWLGRMYFPTV